MGTFQRIKTRLIAPFATVEKAESVKLDTPILIRADSKPLQNLKTIEDKIQVVIALPAQWNSELGMYEIKDSVTTPSTIPLSRDEVTGLNYPVASKFKGNLTVTPKPTVSEVTYAITLTGGIDGISIADSTIMRCVIANNSAASNVSYSPRVYAPWRGMTIAPLQHLHLEGWAGDHYFMGVAGQTVTVLAFYGANIF